MFKIHSSIRIRQIGPAFIIKFNANKGKIICSFLLKSMGILLWLLEVLGLNLNTILVMSLEIEANKNK